MKMIVRKWSSKRGQDFKFGGGTRLQSEGEYALPAYMAGKQVTMKTDVVDSDVPLLLSRTAMKKAGVKMDLKNDTAVIFGEKVSLNFTASGHYCIPLDSFISMSGRNCCRLLFIN